VNGLAEDVVYTKELAVVKTLRLGDVVMVVIIGFLDGTDFIVGVDEVAVAPLVRYLGYGKKGGQTRGWRGPWGTWGP